MKVFINCSSHPMHYNKVSMIHAFLCLTVGKAQVVPGILSHSWSTATSEKIFLCLIICKAQVVPKISATPSHLIQNTSFYLQYHTQISSRSEIADSQPANQPPVAGPMLAVSSQSGNYLPSSAITQNSLKSFEDVVHKNYKLCIKASGISWYTVSNTRQRSIFGKEVMEQCSPNGARDCPCLLRLELNNLEAAMFWLFSRFYSYPELF